MIENERTWAAIEVLAREYPERCAAIGGPNGTDIDTLCGVILGLLVALRRKPLMQIVDDAAARFDGRPLYRASVEAQAEFRPRYFVDHGTIHDRVTSKHVEPDEAVAIMNGAP